jgi:hypothetical protein
MGQNQKKLARRQEPFKNLSSGGQNKILKDWQHKAVIKDATDCATNRGKGATRQMMFNAIVFLRAGDRKLPPTQRYFQYGLKATHEVHKIKTKPIASRGVDMHTEEDIFDWFENVLRPGIYRRDIYDGSRIHNMDKKEARLGMPGRPGGYFLCLYQGDVYRSA